VVLQAPWLRGAAARRRRSAYSPGVRVCILGPLLIQGTAGDVPAGGRLQRRVLARLAMDAGRPVSLDDLEEAVWGDARPRAGRHTIATHVFRLRRLGIDIATDRDRYVLETPTDADELDRLVADGRAAQERHDQATAIASLQAALSCSRGQPLPELDDLPDARIVRTRLEDTLEGLREQLLTLQLDTLPAADLTAFARKLADEQPYRERRWELLMLALYRAGRQADALDAFAECRRRLVDDLGLDPGPALRRMQQAILAQDPSLEPVGEASTGATGAPRGEGTSITPSATLAPPRLPGVSTRLIGRVAERRDLTEVWSRARLATLLGPPGAGKTRLALELAHDAPPPVWYVAVDQIPETQSVAGAILDVVAPSSRAADALTGVVGALADQAGLLVLDGCEGRVDEAGPAAETILGTCHGIRVLTTSRERLGILSEAVLPVGPLGDADAIDLLVDRARLVDPRFHLRPGEEVLADRLCTLVDRLPLGLELVARHLRLLRLSEVIERVQADLGRWAGGPVGGRAGLWAALDSSVQRLEAPERQALLALAVMVADADLDLIAAVAGFSGTGADAFDLVAGLVDASLVQVRSAVGPTRYELLRTLAGRMLDTATPQDAVTARMRYTDAVLARAEDLAARLGTAERSDTLRLLDREMPHIRAVLGATPADSNGGRDTAVRALRLAVALTDYWIGRHPAEGLERLGHLIEAAKPDRPMLAEALLSRGHLAYWVTDFTEGADIVEQARALFAALGDPLGEGRALRRQGAIAAATDDVPQARAFLEASLERLEEAGVEREIGTTLLHLGSLLADEGIVDAARPALERSLAIALASSDPLARGHVLAALTLAHWKGRDLDAAMATGNEALLIFHELGHRPTEGTVAYRLAAVARGLDRPKAARRYAELAIEAGERSTTRTTVALGHVNLARLDLDAGDITTAADHLTRAFDAIDPDADRWVLVEGLEAAARLVAVAEQPGAAALLTAASEIRREIHQPVAPTEAGDLDWTWAHRAATDRVDGAHAGLGGVLDAAAAHRAASRHVMDAAGAAVPPSPRRRMDA
jgi:predicted ATPase/DNA-binding SARP family transcriptional activator